MKLNRKWLLVLALVLSVGMAISGTLAYLTDIESRENIFTVGDVDIKLHEPKWDEKKWGEGNRPMLLPGARFDKNPYIENAGNTDAWVWMKIEMPIELKNVIDFEWDTTGAWSTPMYGQIDGNAVIIVKHNDKLLAPEGDELSKTVEAFTKVFVPETVKELTSDIEIAITVTAYAIQADTFDSVEAAMTAFDVESDAVPSAKITVLDEDDVLNSRVEGATDRIIFNKGEVAIFNGPENIKLDAAYQFQPTEIDANSEYAKWHADFVVTANKDVPANSIGLAGYYDLFGELATGYKWVMLANDEIDIPAGTEVRLVDTMGAYVNYGAICENGNDGLGFLCGAVALKNAGITDAAELEAGTTITVELRIYETKDPADTNNNTSNEENGNYLTVSKTTYTFN